MSQPMLAMAFRLRFEAVPWLSLVHSSAQPFSGWDQALVQSSSI